MIIHQKDSSDPTEANIERSTITSKKQLKDQCIVGMRLHDIARIAMLGSCSGFVLSYLVRTCQKSRRRRPPESSGEKEKRILLSYKHRESFLSSPNRKAVGGAAEGGKNKGKISQLLHSVYKWNLTIVSLLGRTRRICVSH